MESNPKNYLVPDEELGSIDLKSCMNINIGIMNSLGPNINRCYGTCR